MKLPKQTDQKMPVLLWDENRQLCAGGQVITWINRVPVSKWKLEGLEDDIPYWVVYTKPTQNVALLDLPRFHTMQSAKAVAESTGHRIMAHFRASPGTTMKI
jgi:hypothetical protein